MALFTNPSIVIQWKNRNFSTGNTTETQNQLGVSNIQATTTKTQSGVSKIAVTTTKTQSGVANIKVQNTKNQTGVSRIQVTTNQNQTGVAEIRVTVTKTQTGKSSITTPTIQNQLGVANIYATTDKTQTGKGSIAVETLKTQTGVSRIIIQTTQNQPGVANIYATTTKIQLGLSNIQVTTTQNQLGVTRVTKRVLQTQTGVSRIQITSTQTQTGVARIDIHTTRNQLGVADIRRTTTQTQTGVSNILTRTITPYNPARSLTTVAGRFFFKQGILIKDLIVIKTTSATLIGAANVHCIPIATHGTTANIVGQAIITAIPSNRKLTTATIIGAGALTVNTIRVRYPGFFGHSQIPIQGEGDVRVNMIRIRVTTANLVGVGIVKCFSGNNTNGDLIGVGDCFANRIRIRQTFANGAHNTNIVGSARVFAHASQVYYRNTALVGRADCFANIIRIRKTTANLIGAGQTSMFPVVIRLGGSANLIGQALVIVPNYVVTNPFFIIKLEPDALPVGSPTTTIGIVGVGFRASGPNQSVAAWVESPPLFLTTQVISDTFLYATIPSAQLATAKTATVYVFNGPIQSNGLPFYVLPPGGGRGVVRMGDFSLGHDGFPPKRAIEGSPDVITNNRPTVRVGDAWDVHCKIGAGCHGSVGIAGAPHVFANNKHVMRVGDPLDDGDKANEGSPNVFAED
jgi:hypothetical protein